MLDDYQLSMISKEITHRISTLLGEQLINYSDDKIRELVKDYAAIISKQLALVTLGDITQANVYQFNKIAKQIEPTLIDNIHSMLNLNNLLDTVKENIKQTSPTVN